jgi:hypothetical protein
VRLVEGLRGRRLGLRGSGSVVDSTEPYHRRCATGWLREGGYQRRRYGRAMTEWPEGWHPVNAAEAQEYVDAHAGGGGDADLMEECQSFLPSKPAT